MRISLVLRVVAVILSLSVVDGPGGASEPGPEVFDYFHANGDVTVHGTISNLGGVVRSTWTVTRGTNKDTFDQPIKLAEFRSILGGFALPELQQYEVTRDDQRLDFVTFQAISLIVLGKDNKISSRRTFLVPKAPESRKITEWLRGVKIPKDWARR